MLSYIELTIILMIAVIFLKPKDIIYIIAFIKDITLKVKHLLYVGKEEINKIIDETTIKDLKEKSKHIIENNSIKETKNLLDKTAENIENQVNNIYKSVNLNYELDNILNNNNKEDKNKTSLEETNSQSNK